MEAQFVLHLHQMHFTDQNSSEHPSLLTKPQPLQRKANQTLQDVADSIAFSEVSKLGGTTSCCLNGSMVTMTNWPGLEIPVFMAEVAASHQKEFNLSMIAMACGKDGVPSLSTWVFVGKDFEVSNALAVLTLKGVVRTDLSAVFTASKEVGTGSFSQVSVGHLITSEHSQLVVAKQLKSRCPWADVQRECQTLIQAQDCTHIVKYMGVFREPVHNFVAILSEYIDNGDLYSLLLSTGTALCESKAWCIGNCILKALAHLESLEVPILHRDVKSENILVTRHYQSKLCDFGLACFLTDKMSISRQCGSPGNIAPEIFKGDTSCITCKVDVFGLGVIVAHMLHGKHPFRSSSLKSTVNKNMQCKVDYSRSSWIQVSTEAIASTQALLQKNFTDRPSAAEAIKLPWFQRVHELAIVLEPIPEEEFIHDCKNQNSGTIKRKERVLHGCSVTPHMSLPEQENLKETSNSSIVSTALPEQGNFDILKKTSTSSFVTGVNSSSFGCTDHSQSCTNVAESNASNACSLMSRGAKAQSSQGPKRLFSKLCQKLPTSMTRKQKDSSENWVAVVAQPEQIDQVGWTTHVAVTSCSWAARLVKSCKSHQWGKIRVHASNIQS